jgi:hypothetical protein
MEDDRTHLTKSAVGEAIFSRLSGFLQEDRRPAVQIITAWAQGWPELALLNYEQMEVGADGFIRLALWSASRCCMTLKNTKRANLLFSDAETAIEVRCQLVAHNILEVSRPLSGFLLQPTAIVDGQGSAGAVCDGPKTRQGRSNDTRLALLNAFPVIHDGETAPLSG